MKIWGMIGARGPYHLGDGRCRLMSFELAKLTDCPYGPPG